MPRKKERALSPLKVSTAKPGMHADGGCLYLQVTTAAGGGRNRSWIFRYGVPGPDGKTKYRDYGMGSASTFSLSEAREKARQLRQKRYDGIDLVEERRATRATAPVKIVTVAEISDQWMAAHPEWKAPYASAHAQRLRDFILPKIGKLSVRAVGTKEVCEVLDPIWTTKPNTASLTRMVLEQILDYGRAKGHRDDSNPARWDNLKAIYAAATKLRTMKREAEGKTDHHAAMPYKDVAAFMAELRAMDDVAAMALEFVILTAARTSEVLDMPWSEVDLTAKTWTVPAGRMKKKREHRVPLSGAAVAMLNRVAAVRIDDKVFPGLSDKSMRRLLQRRMKRAVSVHGFRSAFRTWGGEETSFPADVLEAALAHLKGDKTEEAYNHGTLFAKRRGLMDAWAAYVGPAVVGKVVPMPKKKRAAG